MAFQYANVNSGGMSTHYHARSLKKKIDKWKNDVGKGGVCHGMAKIALLVKKGAMELDSIQNGLKSLHSVSDNKASKSAIGFYQISQKFTKYDEAKNTFMARPLSEQIKALGTTRFPYFLSYGKDGWGSHAVVAKSMEHGKWVFHNTEYNNRICIYDPNYPNGTNSEQTCLYFNSESLAWEVPAYYDSGVSSKKGAYLKAVIGDINILNDLDLQGMRDKYGAWLRSSDDLFQLNFDGKHYGITGEKSSVKNVMSVSYDEGVLSKEGYSPALDVYLHGSPKLTIIPKGNNTDFDTDILYPNYFLSATVDKCTDVTFDPDGAISVDGISDNYNLELTANDGYINLPWDTISVSGDDATEISINVVDDGIEIQGDDLHDITVTGSNDNKSENLDVSTDKNKITVISDKNGHISIKTDDSSLFAPKNLAATGIGNKKVKLTWSKVAGADGYLIIGLNNVRTGKQIGFTNQLTWTDTAANSEDFNYYWVIPYYKNSAGKIIKGNISNYVYAVGRTVGKAGKITASTATKNGQPTVYLKWPAVSGANEYLIIYKEGNSAKKTQYTNKTEYTFANPAIDEVSYYWVCGIYKNAAGRRIVAGAVSPYAWIKVIDTSNAQVLANYAAYLEEYRGGGFSIIYLSDDDIPDMIYNYEGATSSFLNFYVNGKVAWHEGLGKGGISYGDKVIYSFFPRKGLLKMTYADFPNYESYFHVKYHNDEYDLFDAFEKTRYGIYESYLGPDDSQGRHYDHVFDKMVWQRKITEERLNELISEYSGGVKEQSCTYVENTADNRKKYLGK